MRLIYGIWDGDKTIDFRPRQYFTIVFYLMPILLLHLFEWLRVNKIRTMEILLYSVPEAMPRIVLIILPN